MNFMESQNVLCVLLKYFGLTAYHHDKNVKRVISNYKDILLSVILFIIIGGLTTKALIKALLETSTNSMGEWSQTDIFITIFDYIVFSLHLVIITFNNWIKRKKQIKLFNNILAFDALESFHMSAYHEKEYRKTWMINIIIWVVYFLIIGLCFFIFLYVLNILDNKAIFIFIIQSIYQNLVIYFLTTIVRTLKQQFIIINKNFDLIIKDIRQGDRIRDEIHARHLKYWFKCYVQTCENIKLFSNCFGVILAGCYVQNFLVIAIEFYLLFKIFVFAENDIMNVLYVIPDAIWTTFYSCFMCLLFYECQAFDEMVSVNLCLHSSVK